MEEKKYEDPGYLVVSPEELETFCRLLHEKTGNSCHHYKNGIVARRISRRMHLRGVSSVAEYLRLVEESDLEASLIALDMMIGVTSFFRDLPAWKALRSSVLTKLPAEPTDQPIRIWTPACATGEEAYSIAMMLHHELELAGQSRKIQVFATDIDERSLVKARAGTYPASSAVDVPGNYMQYFTLSADGHFMTISQRVRDSLIFSRQDILVDPPFSRLDLIICRNFLIYLEPHAQQKCLFLFHYALKEGGHLFLGSAESVGRGNELFKSVGLKKCRLYRKREDELSHRPKVPVPFSAEGSMTALAGGMLPVHFQQSAVGAVLDSLLNEHLPPSAGIDRNYDILYHNGPMENYLHPPGGPSRRNLLDFLAEKSRSAFRGAVYRAERGEQSVAVNAAIKDGGGEERDVLLNVSQLRKDVFLVVLRRDNAATGAGGQPAVNRIEEELTMVDSDLQIKTERLITVNQALKASNEELQAVNEELETSREELHCLNEELQAVNRRLQSKIEEQEETNANLNNLLAGTAIPALFLDRRLKVKHFTPALSRLLDIIPSDLERSIAYMPMEGLGPGLLDDVRHVLEIPEPLKKEVHLRGKWYQRIVLPYRSADGRTEGVVITYNDVSTIKKAEEGLRESEERVRHKLDSIISPAGGIPNLDLADIIDVPAVQSLMDNFYELCRIPMSIIDIKGKVLVGKGWQEICLRFHRVNPQTCRNCVESDLELATGIPAGEFKLYRCKNNMWDMATPIMVGDQHLGNVFMGQFFFDDEELDYPGFRSQAREYGFDEDDYIAALEKVPRLSRNEVEHGMAYLMKFADLISRLSYSNLKLARSVAERDALTDSLRESEERLRLFIEHAPVAMAMFDRQMRYLSASRRWMSNYGLAERSLMGRSHYEIIPEMPEHWKEAHRRGLAGEVVVHEGDRFEGEDGREQWLRWEVRPWTGVAGQVGGIVIFTEDITERKRSENAVMRAKEEWERTFDAVPDLIAILDGRHRIVRVNKAMAERLGVTPKECVGRFCYEMVHGLGSPPDFCPHAMTLAGCGQAEAEVHESRLGGHFLVTTTPVIDKAGQQIGAVHVARDITERITAEEELRQSEARLSRAQEIAHLGSWELNLENNSLLWSDEAYRIFGLQPGEFEATYEAFLDTVHPDDRAAVDAAYSASLQEGRDSYETEHRVVRKGTGEVRIVREKCEHFRDASGRVVRSVGMVHDITEKKLAEDEIKKRIAVRIGINMILDEALRCETDRELANAALSVAQQVTGSGIGSIAEVGADGILREIASTATTGEVCARLKESKASVQFHGNWIFSQVLQGGESLITNSPVSHGKELPEGHPGIGNLMAVPLRYGDRTIGIIAVANREGGYGREELDSLESIARTFVEALFRKRAEEALRKAHDELEAKVEERTAELREKDQLLLMQSRQAAMGEMIGNIAHQWRQPLNALSLIVQTLPVMRQMGELTQEYLDSIEERSMGIIRHMSQTIDDFRNYFRPDKEKLPFSVKEAVEMTLSLIRDSFNCRPIKVKVVVLDQPPIINGYMNEYCQVLLNILLNSRDAFPAQKEDAEVVITIGSENGRAVVTIADNAGGIDEAIMDKIFEPYFTTKGPDQGTGVGLFMSKAIIEKSMGGRLTARNTGEGAEFRIEV